MVKILYADVTGDGGGSNVSLQALLSALDRSTYLPVLVFGRMTDGGPWAAESTHVCPFIGLDNFDFFPAGWNLRWIYQFVQFVVRFPFDLARASSLVRKVRPDIVHLNGGQLLTFAVAARISGIPVVWHIRELVVDNWLGKLQDRMYAALADRIIVPSNSVAGRLPCARTKSLVIPNGVVRRQPISSAVQEFRNLHHLHQEDFVVLLLGRALSISKGYSFLADVAEMVDPGLGIKFLLAGRSTDADASVLHRFFRSIYRTGPRAGGEKARILKRWDTVVRQGKAAFTGFIDPAVAIAASDLIVCPNLVAEPFGRTVAEARMQGRPVAATNVPAFTELIEHDRTGWLLPPEPKAWAALLNRLSRDRALVSRIGREASSASGRYDASECGKRAMEVYASMLSRSA